MRSVGEDLGNSGEGASATLAAGVGAQLVEALRWVHAAIRHDVGACQALAEAVAAGAPAAHVRGQLADLRTTGVLWTLRVRCLHACRFVHAHHGHEDHLLFPALRRSNPALTEAVDRLEADHRTVSRLLDETESAAAALADVGDVPGRRRLVDALRSLTATLLVHLDLEEDLVTPTLLRWTAWP